MKRKSVLNVHFEADCARVWDAIANNAVPGNVITPLTREEYDSSDKAGDETYVAITDSVTNERYAFSMKNAFLTGNYSADLSPSPDGGTDVAFTDEVEFEGLAMYILSLFAVNIKKSQLERASGIKSRLGETDSP